MRTIIAGTRTIEDYKELLIAVKRSGFLITEVVSGTAKGVDSMGERWAKENDIPIARFKPDWDAWGDSAGYFRNVEMAKYAQQVLVVWDGKSRGSASMIRIAKMRSMPLYEHKVDLNWF